MLLYWSPDYQDPHANASAFAYNPDKPGSEKASTVASRNNWFMPDISAETMAAARENDPGKREAMYLDLQKKLRDGFADRHLFQKIEQTVTTSNLKGFVSGSSSDTVFYRLVTK